MTPTAVTTTIDLLTKTLMTVNLSESIPHGTERMTVIVNSVLKGLVASGKVRGYGNFGFTGPTDDPILNIPILPVGRARVEVVKLQVKHLSKDLLDVWDVISL